MCNNTQNRVCINNKDPSQYTSETVACNEKKAPASVRETKKKKKKKKKLKWVEEGEFQQLSELVGRG